MAVLITGASLTLSINGVDRSGMTTSATLTPNESRTHTHYIGGTQSDTQTTVEFTLDVEMDSDVSKSTAGFIEAIWGLASTAPNTPVPFILTNNEVTFSGNLYPMFPSIGGSATDVQTVSFSFPTAGAPTAVWS